MATERENSVLFITRWYPSPEDPMFGLFIKNHALAVSAAGFKVTVAYVTSASAKKIKYISREVSKSDSITEVLIYYNKSSVFSPLLQLIAWIKAINMAIKLSGKPAIVHAHILTRVGLLANLFSCLYRIPFVVTEHWSRYYNENPVYKGFLRKAVTKFVLSKASAITVVSERLGNSMKARGLDFQYELVPNVVDVNLFKPDKVKGPVFRFISITCFEEKSKNLKILIDAASEIEREGFVFELVFVGDGADKRMIEEYALGKCKIIYTGSLSQAKAANELQLAHCLVLSSNYETFGIVALEAMASGVPVIATDVADLQHIVTSDCGIVVPSGNKEELKSAMKKVFRDYKSFDPALIRSHVVGIYDLKAIGERLTGLYKSVLKMEK